MVKWAPEDEQSDFNQGVATLQRIHSALLELALTTIHSDHLKRYKVLMVLYKELRPMMSEKTKKDVKTQKVLQSEREEFKKLKENADDGFNKLSEAIRKKKNKINRQWLTCFDDLEMELRDLIQKKGMGLPQKRDPRYALAGK